VINEVKQRCGEGEMSVHQSTKIRNVTVLVYSVLLSQFLYYYYLNYHRLINAIFIGIVLAVVFVF
jgi:uncharacterized membrane protein